MREAISNLVDNAIKFTPAGGEIRITARMIDSRPALCISDTGCGVPPAERTKIFRRFYRGGQGGETPGHGLGLSIAESIARLHGLELTVADNSPGARFEMRAVAQASRTVEGVRLRAAERAYDQPRFWPPDILLFPDLQSCSGAAAALKAAAKPKRHITRRHPETQTNH